MNVLKWPIITYVVSFVVFVAALLASPGIEKLYPFPEGDFVLFLVFGVWTGYKMVELGGKYYDGFIGGAIVGVVAGVLEAVFFTMSGMAADTLSGFLFGLVTNVTGALIGAGYGATK